MSQSDLVRSTGVDRSTLADMMTRMERNGWVAKEPGVDARSHTLKLTSEGRKKLQQAVPHWRKAQDEAEDLLGKGGRDTIQRVTKRIRGF